MRIRRLNIAGIMVYTSILLYSLPTVLNLPPLAESVLRVVGLIMSLVGVLYFFEGRFAERLERLNVFQNISRREGIFQVDWVDFREYSGDISPIRQAGAIKVVLDRNRLSPGIHYFIEEILAFPTLGKMSILLAGSLTQNQSRDESTSGSSMQKLVNTRRGRNVQVRTVDEVVFQSFLLIDRWAFLLVPLEDSGRLLLQVRFDPHSPTGIRMSEDFDRLWQLSVDNSSTGE